MLSFIFKNLKYVLDAAIIIALLLVFAFWDPFGLFGTRLQTKDTANIVEQIREIGELTTAEFYGEVIASWKEGKLTEIKESEAPNLARKKYGEILSALWAVYNSSDDVDDDKDAVKVKKKNIVELIGNVNSSVRSGIYMNVLKSEGVLQKFKCKERDDEKDVLWEMYSVIKDLGKNDSKKGGRTAQDFAANDSSVSFTAFYKDLQSDIKAELKERKNKNKNIVFIGRGWVKAGFDFSRLNENNFFYDEENATITFIGVQPKILDSVINPWFVPENEIKGFELVSEDGDLSFEDAIFVKTECKRKLMAQAVNAKIIDNAYLNGQTALKSFFSLILGVEIKHVRFTADKFYTLQTQLSKDSLITLEESIIINQHYQEELKAIKNERNSSFKNKKIKNLKLFLSELQKNYFLDKKKDSKFNYFSLLSGKIIGDYNGVKVLDSNELGALVAYRTKLKFKSDTSLPDTLQKDEAWFKNNSSYMADFNTAIELVYSSMDSIFSSDTMLTKLQFAYPEYELYVKNSQCNCTTSGKKSSALDAIQSDECSYIKARISSLKTEKENEFFGVPHKLNGYMEEYKINKFISDVRNHFNKEK